MNGHLLVIDDEAQLRELLGLCLEKHGYQVSTVASSEEALQLLGERHIDLAVLDIGLANEDGLAVLGQLKNRQPDLRVVMLTGMGFVEDLLQEALSLGADGYVSKVMPLDELLSTIHRLLDPQDLDGPSSAAA
jgi:DNA-binding response OmpR family regulator